MGRNKNDARNRDASKAIKSLERELRELEKESDKWQGLADKAPSEYEQDQALRNLTKVERRISQVVKDLTALEED